METTVSFPAPRTASTKYVTSKTEDVTTVQSDGWAVTAIRVSIENERMA